MPCCTLKLRGQSPPCVPLRRQAAIISSIPSPPSRKPLLARKGEQGFISHVMKPSSMFPLVSSLPWILSGGACPGLTVAHYNQHRAPNLRPPRHCRMPSGPDPTSRIAHPPPRHCRMPSAAPDTADAPGRRQRSDDSEMDAAGRCGQRAPDTCDHPAPGRRPGTTRLALRTHHAQNSGQESGRRQTRATLDPSSLQAFPKPDGPQSTSRSCTHAYPGYVSRALYCTFRQISRSV